MHPKNRASRASRASLVSLVSLASQVSRTSRTSRASLSSRSSLASRTTLASRASRASRATLLAALCACGSDDAVCIEERVAITQGLYGHVTYQTDVNPHDSEPTPIAGEVVDVLDSPNGAVVANGVADDAGVFQISLGAGIYALCASDCVPLTVTNERVVRADLRKSFGGAFWSIEPASDCVD